MGGQHVATADLGDMNDKESSVFRNLLLPDDSYDEAGTYWADMPLMKKIRFVNKVNNEEAKKELKSIGRMIKADPLSPLGFYVRNMIIPGAGLLLEGYVGVVVLLCYLANLPLGTSFSPLGTTLSYSSRHSLTAGIRTKPAKKSGYRRSNTSKLLASSSVRFLSVSSVTGLADATVSYRMPPSCSSVL